MMFDFNNDTSSTFASSSSPTFFGLSIPTHRSPQFLYDNGNNDNGGSSSSSSSSFTHFPYEPIIAAIAIVFFRMTVKIQMSPSSPTTRTTIREEPLLLRYISAIILGILAYKQQSYQHITMAELSSYMISYVVLYIIAKFPATKKTTTKPDEDSNARQQNANILLSLQRFALLLIGTIVSVILSYGIVISCCNPILQQYFMKYMVPKAVQRSFFYLFPIQELQKAYTIMEQFMMMEQEFFHHMIHHLFFVTFHIQVGMGYLGIAFLRSEQSRRNQLIRLDVYDDNEQEEMNHGNDGDNDNGVQNNQPKERRHQNGASTNGKHVLTKQEQYKNKKRNNKEKQMAEKSRIFQRGAAPFSTYRTFTSFV